MLIARQDRVIAISEDGKMPGEVKPIDGAHGTAPGDSIGRGFAPSGNDRSVVMFDLKT